MAPEKAPAWNERDPKQVELQGIAMQSRTDWRRVTITSDPLNGDIVVEYGMLKGAAESRRYSPKQFYAEADNLIRAIALHVTP